MEGLNFRNFTVYFSQEEATARRLKTICQHNNNLFPSNFPILLFQPAHMPPAEHLPWVPLKLSMRRHNCNFYLENRKGIRVI